MMNIIKKYNKNYTQYDDRICLIYNIKIKNKNSMGACCIRENNVIKISQSKKEQREKIKSTRSSIYQINKEDINDVYDFCGKISSGYYGTVVKAFFKNDPSKFYAVKSIAKSNLSQKNLKNFLILVTEEMILVLGLR